MLFHSTIIYFTIDFQMSCQKLHTLKTLLHLKLHFIGNLGNKTFYSKSLKLIDLT